MTALVLLSLAFTAAPGCPAAIAAAAATPDAGLARTAPALVSALGAAGGAGPTAGLAAAARALEAGETTPDAFRAALARHCALAAAPAPGLRATEGDRAALSALLDGEAYRRARLDPRALRRVLEDLWARLLELLGTNEAGRYAEAGRALYLGAAVIALALGLAALRRRALRGRAPVAVASPVAAYPAPADPDGGLARAEAALARGETREAVREAFLAGLAALERDGRLPRDRARTNAELSAAVAATTLPALAATFDRAVYGRRTVALDEAAAAVLAARGLANGTASIADAATAAAPGGRA